MSFCEFFFGQILAVSAEPSSPSQQVCSATSQAQDKPLQPPAHSRPAQKVAGLFSRRPTEKQSDQSLLAAAASGDSSAIVKLYDRHSKCVFSVSLRILGDRRAAGDVLHRIFLKLSRVPQQFDRRPGHLGLQLALIARNDSILILHSQIPRTDLPDIAGEWTANAGYSRRAKAVRELLRSLSTEEQVALDLACFEGLTHQEIAEKTKVAPEFIGKRIRDGLVALRKAI